MALSAADRVLVKSILLSVFNNIIFAYHGSFQHLFHDNPEFHHGHAPLFYDGFEFHHSRNPASKNHADENDNEETAVETFNGASNSIPLELTRDMNKYQYNLNDLLLHMGFINSPLLQDRFGEEVRNAEIVKCIPVLTIVNFIDKEDGRVSYFPQCTKIERCGGCCKDNRYSCQPTETKPVSFKVVKVRSLRFIGKEVKKIEKHLKCECKCKVTAEDCTRSQQYNEVNCSCACANLDEEKKCSKLYKTKQWDPNLCTCNCTEITPCSTGFEFDPDYCKCTETPSRRYNKYERRGYEEEFFDVMLLN